MPLITVLIPTFNHQDTIKWAVKSVQNQTIQDFEILVVGDGAPQRTNDIMADLCRQDERIHYFANPKDPAQGEIYRHQALQKASGKYVCYLSDDDLWLEHHLEVILSGLRDSDFCHTLHTGVSPEGDIYVLSGDYASKTWTNRILTEEYTIHGLSFSGHSLAAYRRLPFGWRPRPVGVPCDLHMWRQWASQGHLTLKTIPHITSLHFDAPPRDQWTTDMRVRELREWYEASREASFPVLLNRKVLSFYQVNSIREKQIIELVDICFKAREYKKAAELMQETLEKNPNWHLFKYLADIYLADNRTLEAISLLDKALRLFPGIRHAHSFYGEVLMESGDQKTAISVFRKATQLPDTDYDDFLRLAEAQIRSEKRKDAIASLLAGNKKFPKNPDIADLLAQYDISIKNQEPNR